LIELILHGRVVFNQFFDGQIVSLIVGESQMIFTRKQGIFGFIQVVNRFVN
jgi:hypothetical protein